MNHQRLILYLTANPTVLDGATFGIIILQQEGKPQEKACSACLFPEILNQGRAIAQAVSRRLLTAAARFRAQVRSCGISG
jgi:hypothetical protein